VLDDASLTRLRVDIERHPVAEFLNFFANCSDYTAALSGAFAAHVFEG
jgi:hypothetical protein